MNDLTKIILSVLVAVGLSTGANIFSTNDRLARLEIRLEHLSSVISVGILPHAEKRISQLEWHYKTLEKRVDAIASGGEL